MVLVTGSTEFNSEVMYTCEAGYSLVNGETHICQADGTWSGKEPLCNRRWTYSIYSFVFYLPIC